MMDYLEDVSKSTKEISKKKSSAEKSSVEKAVKTVEKNTEAKNDYLSILKNGCKEGERNATTTKLAGSLFKSNLKEGTILEILRMWNQRNTPPMGDSELKKTFNSVKEHGIEISRQKNRNRCLHR